MIATQTLCANRLSFTVSTAGDGDTVALMLHGFPEGRQAWDEQLEPLAGLGWRTAAPDLRGYGDSDRPAGRSAYRIDELVADVEGLFAALGARRRILIGHDWGGVIAWQVAMRKPALLDGLVVLNAPHPAVYRHLYRSSLRQKLRSWYILAFALPGLPERALTADQGRPFVAGLKRQAPGFPDDRLETYRRNILRPGVATAMINYYRANMVELGAGPLPKTPIGAPTLLIWGENDPFLDVALVDGHGAQVTDLTVKRLPGVPHWVCEAASDTVNATVADWARAKGLTRE